MSLARLRIVDCATFYWINARWPLEYQLCGFYGVMMLLLLLPVSYDTMRQYRSMIVFVKQFSKILKF